MSYDKCGVARSPCVSRRDLASGHSPVLPSYPEVAFTPPATTTLLIGVLSGRLETHER